MKKEKKRTVQDAVIPLDDALEGLVFFEDLFEVFPIWLCPLKIRHELNTPDMLLTFPRKHDYYIDIGVWPSKKGCWGWGVGYWVLASVNLRMNHQFCAE